MSSNESNAPKNPSSAAKPKSPIVTRRRALHMAFHRAVAALGDARKKATSGLLQAAAQKAAQRRTPESGEK